MDSQLFDFGGHNVRVVMDERKEPWFVLKDVCDVLELEAKHVKPRLNSEDTNKVANTDPNRGRGNPHIITVNESGLYDVIFQSRKPEANPLLVHDTAVQEVPSLGYNEGR